MRCIGLTEGFERIIAQGSSVILHAWMYRKDRGIVGRNVDRPPSRFLPYLRCIFFLTGSLSISSNICWAQRHVCSLGGEDRSAAPRYPKVSDLLHGSWLIIGSVVIVTYRHCHSADILHSLHLRSIRCYPPWACLPPGSLYFRREIDFLRGFAKVEGGRLMWRRRNHRARRRLWIFQHDCDLILCKESDFRAQVGSL